jgi:hypothetical protein
MSNSKLPNPLGETVEFDFAAPGRKIIQRIGPPRLSEVLKAVAHEPSKRVRRAAGNC